MKRKSIVISLAVVLIIIMSMLVILAIYRNRGEQIYIFNTPYEKTQYVISDENVVMYGVRGKIISETDTMFTVEQTEGRHATFVVDKNLLVMENPRDISYSEIDGQKLEIGDESVSLQEPFILNTKKLDDGIYFQNNEDLWQFLASIDELDFIQPRKSGTDISGQLFEDRIDITMEDEGNHIIYGDGVYETRINTYDSGHNKYEGYQLVYFNTLSGLTARQHLVDVKALLKAYGYEYKIIYNKETKTYQMSVEE